MVTKYEEILHIFPDYMRGQWKNIVLHADELQEIRLRIDREVILLMGNQEYYLSESGQAVKSKEEAYCMTEREMDAVLNHICSYSIYAFEDEIKQGFLTIPGGHRIGLAGQVVLQEDSKVRNIKHIRYMNIRISHEIKGVANQMLPYIYEKRQLKNTLLISPPGCGKTTLLRDMIRQISDGNNYGEGMNVAIVDERSEIAGSYMGKPQNDIGMRTDVLDACPKILGMMMLIRSMAPRVVAVDELGCGEDMKAVYQVMQCGIKVIATIHGDSLKDIINKSYFSDFVKNKNFERYILMEKEEGRYRIKEIYDRSFQTCCAL